MPFPVQERYLVEAEAELGVRLPADLRVRLMKCNGGRVEVAEDYWELHPVFDKSNRKRISRTASHIVRETDYARTWPGFPPDAIAVGSNGTADRLMLLPDPDNQGQCRDELYLWDHETGEAVLVADGLGEVP